MPGLVFNPRFLQWHVYAPMMPEGLLLNERHVMLPFDMIAGARDLLRHCFGQSLFLRPDSPWKLFPGVDVDIDDLERELSAIRQIYNPDPADMVVISKAVPLPVFEYRFWMINGKALSPAGYALHARHGDAPPCPDPLMKAAQKLAEHLDWIAGDMVADFVLLEGQPKLVELNALSTSGFYPQMNWPEVHESLNQIIV